MKVYPNTNSLVIVGLNTWVSDAVTESDRFLPITGVGYGSCWFVLVRPQLHRERLRLALQIVADE